MPATQPQPLTRDGFAQYGGVVAIDGTAGHPANDGRALRHDQPITLEHGTQADDPVIALYAVEASTLPLEVDHLERHPASCQAFFPMNADRYLIVVAGAGARGEPDPASLRAFVGTGTQGVCYAPGVWHYPLVSLDRAGTFAMFMWRAPDAADDCEVRTLDTTVEVRP